MGIKKFNLNFYTEMDNFICLNKHKYDRNSKGPQRPRRKKFGEQTCPQHCHPSLQHHRALHAAGPSVDRNNDILHR
jgi:hypothetical protein